MEDFCLQGSAFAPDISISGAGSSGFYLLSRCGMRKSFLAMQGSLTGWREPCCEVF
jgi:hypothetical protein